MEIKKYLFISDTLSFGGAQRVASLLSSGIAEKGYEVHLILYERVQNEYPLSDKVKIHLLPKRDKEHILKYYFNKLVLIRNLIKKINPDVIIPFLPDQTIHFFVASRLLKIPFILSIRNNPLEYPESKMKRVLYKIIAKCSTGLFLQTEEQTKYFSSKLLKKIFVVSNPVNTDLLDLNYKHKKEINTVSTFGRLSPQKNQKLLIDAFSEIHKKYNNIILNIYGEGSEEDNLKKRVYELNLHFNVNFKGRVNNVGEELMKSDLFVLTSDYEGLPNALMEAMAVGIPCISTNCPTGPSDLIDNEVNGLLINVNDKDQLVEAIEKLIVNSTLCEKFSELSKNKMRNEYSIDIIIKRFIKEVNTLVRISENEKLSKF